MGFLGGLCVKKTPANVREADLIPGLGRSLGEGNCNLLQYSCPEKSHGQRNLAGCSPWDHRVRYDLATKQQQNKLTQCQFLINDNTAFN